jgi:hypothetical protein
MIFYLFARIFKNIIPQGIPMEKDSSFSAQQRTDQIKSFQAELQRLADENVFHLTAEQDNKIKKYHQTLLSDYMLKFDIDRSKNEKQLSLGMKVASFLAALGLAFSVLFLFLRFWGSYQVSTQVVILILAPSILLAATMYLSRFKNTSYYTKILSLLTFVTFVLNLSMLGQIFNITPSPNAFIVWAAFALLLAYALDARLLLGVGILFFAFFLSAKIGVWGGGYWINFSEHPENFFPVALILFFLSFMKYSKHTTFDVVYRYFSLLFFFIPVLILSNYGSISYLELNTDFIEGFYQIVGFGMSALAIYVGIRKGLSEVSNTANVFFVIFLYTKLYNWWWDWMPKYIFFFIIGISAFLILVLLKRFRNILLQNTQGKVL